MNLTKIKFFFIITILYNISGVKSLIAELDTATKSTIVTVLRSIRKKHIQFYSGPKVKDPKVSIVIPIFNGENYIEPLVTSIQQQSMKEIEIVFVDDFSKDNTYQSLLEAQKKDHRIKIIKNKKNRGIMYSRMWGALQSIGEYVTFLDCDDLYFKQDILEVAYNTAISKNLDLIQYQYFGSTFDGKQTYDYIVGYVSRVKENVIITAPDVKKELFGQSDYPGGSGIVYDKLYRRDLIEKMENFLGDDLIHIHLIFMEDFLISFGAFRCAERYMLINEFGVWHWNKNPDGMTSKVSEIDGDKYVYPEYSNKKIGDYLTIWEKMFEYTEDNPDDGRFRLNVLFILIVPNDLRKIFSLSYHYEKLLNICKKFYTWKYLTFDLKIHLQKYCQGAVELSIPLKKKYSLFFE